MIFFFFHSLFRCQKTTCFLMKKFKCDKMTEQQRQFHVGRQLLLNSSASGAKFTDQMISLVLQLPGNNRGWTFHIALARNDPTSQKYGSFGANDVKNTCSVEHLVSGVLATCIQGKHFPIQSDKQVTKLETSDFFLLSFFLFLLANSSSSFLFCNLSTTNLFC